MLLGQYRLSMDDKGRLSIPSALRHTLHEHYAPDDSHLVVMKFFEDCLVIYPRPVWLEIESQLLELPNDPFSRAFVRRFCASANVCSLDRQGRILVSAALRQYAGIDSEVLLIGMMKKMELWSPARWEAYESNMDAQFDTNVQLMGLRL
ncbi:MAG TPA: division/cell wall cluster transcriptional repressor MraZ [Candidatus Entotheonella sp.]|jgi:MraZ protein